MLLLFEFFTPALADGFSLEFEWQQVSSSLQDSSQYPSRSQQCCSLDALHSSSYFQVLKSLYESFDDCTKSTNYNWYKRHFHVPQFFQFSSKVQVFIFLSFLFCSQLGQQSRQVYIIIIIYSFRVFHISISWWFFTGVWVTASHLKSPGLVLGFLPFSAMLSFRSSLLVRQLPSPPGFLIIL